MDNSVDTDLNFDDLGSTVQNFAARPSSLPYREIYNWLQRFDGLKDPPPTLLEKLWIGYDYTEFNEDLHKALLGSHRSGHLDQQALEQLRNMQRALRDTIACRYGGRNLIGNTHNNQVLPIGVPYSRYSNIFNFDFHLYELEDLVEYDRCISKLLLRVATGGFSFTSSMVQCLLECAMSGVPLLVTKRKAGLLKFWNRKRDPDAEKSDK